MSRQEQAALHAAIFDAHPFEGWNYIRRSGHAIGSRDSGRLLLQYTGSLVALTHVGYDFLYRYLVALAAACPVNHFVEANIGAARLAPRLWGRGGRRRAISHYRRALERIGTDAASALPIMHEIANVYATMRTPPALQKARAWYEAAFERLELIPDLQERLSAEIRLHNGLALVDYHQQCDQAALDHEQKALALIASLPKKNVRWAEPLVRTNTAKLLIKRFGDADGGICLLQTLLDNPESRVRWTCQQNLGRACFDKHDYSGAVEHLAFRVESEEGQDLSETEELYDRLIFTLSLLALKDSPRAAKQIPRMRYLAQVNATGSAEAVINQIETVCSAFQAAA
jgi:tetratricopeptide (TPR) repeat protein